MSQDQLNTIAAALAPGAIGFVIGTIGLFIRVPQWRHRRIWFAALTFILLQGIFDAFVVVAFGGRAINAGLFTVTAGIGLTVYVVALIGYGFKALGRSPPA